MIAEETRITTEDFNAIAACYDQLSRLVPDLRLHRSSLIRRLLVPANETGNAAGLVLAAASGLSKQSEQLSAEVSTFLAGVRAA